MLIIAMFLLFGIIIIIMEHKEGFSSMGFAVFCATGLLIAGGAFLALTSSMVQRCPDQKPISESIRYELCEDHKIIYSIEKDETVFINREKFTKIENYQISVMKQTKDQKPYIVKTQTVFENNWYWLIAVPWPRDTYEIYYAPDQLTIYN